MTFSTFRAALAVGVFSSFAATAFAQAPIQAPLNGTAQPSNPVTSIPIAPTKKATFSDDEIKALGQGPVFPYSLLDQALYGAVTETGEVNYNKLQGNDSLTAFVRAVGLADMTQFPVFTEKDADGKTFKNRDAELIFWINAYNGLFLDTIAKAYPIKAVSQVKDLDTAKTHLVAGKTYSFAEMRKTIGTLDPRALFVLLDGTSGGPRATPTAFRFSGIDRQLEAGVKSYVDDITRVTVPDRVTNSVTVSTWMQNVDPFFKAEVGRKKWGGIKTVLAGYISQNANKRYFATGDFEVKFFPPVSQLNDTINSGTVIPTS